MIDRIGAPMRLNAAVAQAPPRPPVAAPGCPVDRVDLAAAVNSPSPSARKFDCDVLIVGAGMSGLSAARSLQAAGRSVQVVEARDCIGGRIFTDRSSFDRPADLGAFWLHQDGANPNPLVAEAARLGFETRSDAQTELAADGVHDPAAEGEIFGETRDEIHDQWMNAAKNGTDRPISEFPVAASKWSGVAADSLVPLDLGVEAPQASLRDYAVMADEADDRVLPGGMGQFIEAYGKDVPVTTGAPVTHVKWGADGVEVVAGDRTIRARKLLLTVSTGVLNGGGIVFDPPLPAWKRDAIEHIPMGHFNKVVMQFDPGVLPPTEPGSFLYVMHPPHHGMDFVLEPFGADMVVGFVGGDHARELEQAGEQAAVDEALGLLSQATRTTDLKSHLRKAVVTHWGTDPYSLGSYSAAQPGYQHMRAELKRPIDGVLHFAGEATEDRYATTVAGAFRSGQRAAAELDRSLVSEHA